MKFGSETPTTITSTFTFSPVNLATLGATEYTLVKTRVYKRPRAQSWRVTVALWEKLRYAGRVRPTGGRTPT